MSNRNDRKMVHRESWSIGWACALGAFIGTLIALKLETWLPNLHLAWIAGALIGGGVGWVSYDLRQARDGLVLAYRTTTLRQPLYWKKFLSLSSSVLLAHCILVVPTILLLHSVLGHPYKQPLWQSYVVFVAIALVFIPAFVAVMIFREKDQSVLERACVVTPMWMIRRCNPISLLWLAVTNGLPYIPRIRRGTVWLTAKAASHIGNFLWLAFTYIHSERRKICFVDAALGACVGYSCNAPLIGAVVGAAFGIVNYEVVSKRWLKLALTQ